MIFPLSALPFGWFTISEAARYFRLSRSTVYSLISSGQWPSSVLPGVRGRRLSPADVAEIERRAAA